MEKKNTKVVICALIAVLSAIVAGVSAYLLPHIPLVWQVSGGISVATLILYLALDLEFYRDVFSKKTARYGLNSVFMAIIVIFIVAVINMIANGYDLKKDLTKNKLNSLSEQTVKVLKNMDTDITMKVFVQPNQLPAFNKVLDRYLYHSKRLKKEIIDPDKDPMAVQTYNIKSSGTIIFESPARTSRVENLRNPDDPKLEEKLTNSIIQVAKGDKRKIYFLKGHGERIISDSGSAGYSQIKASLESGRYNVEELLLLDAEKVPEDAEILIIAGPKSTLIQHELDVIQSYLARGGKLLLMVDPQSTPTVAPLLKTLGAKWQPKTAVFETNKLQQFAGGNPLAPIVMSYDRFHNITKDTQHLTIFPVASPMEKAEKAPEGVKVTTLFSTSGRSLEAKLKGNRVNVDQKKARKGPLSLALAVSGKLKSPEPKVKEADKNKLVDPKDEKKDEAKKEKDPEFRAVVVGDSDFPSNSVRDFGMNADLFQNMLSWLAKEEDLIAIRPKPKDVSEFEITDARVRIINLASIFVLPILMLVFGIGVRLSRRRK